jgi:hypothetical protein
MGNSEESLISEILAGMFHGVCDLGQEYQKPVFNHGPHDFL